MSPILAGVGGTPDELANAQTERRGAGDDADIPPPGASIGRFRVEGVLGTGGMGVVVSARDPDLGRAVALKLVRVAGAGSSDDDEGRARLLREARAMAQLRHANVLTIYEAGTHGQRVYVAMEQVSGGTLRSWLEREGHADWRAIVDRFAAAGAGLAAAHAAGLVHRDFKPENVLVDGERVLVADFGLVGAPSASTGLSSDSTAPIGEPITRVGAVMGTPAYMAPEQHHGEAVDARSDQFSFCVALFEALYGVRPFRGGTRADIVRAMADNAVRAVERKDVPTWIHSALLRGLRYEPGERFDSMAALLDQLATDANRARLGGRARQISIGIVGAVVIGWAAASFLIEYQLTLRAMAIVDAGFFALVALVGVLNRRDMAIEFNRQVYAIGAAAVIATLVLVAGGMLSNAAAPTIALMHLFTVFCFALMATVFLERKLAVVAVGYAAAFFASASAYSLFFPASIAAHGTMIIAVMAVLGDRNR